MASRQQEMDSYVMANQCVVYSEATSVDGRVKGL
jgi:hypothetical protein